MHRKYTDAPISIADGKVLALSAVPMYGSGWAYSLNRPSPLVRSLSTCKLSAYRPVKTSATGWPLYRETIDLRWCYFY